jgi:hypothetical protein
MSIDLLQQFSLDDQEIVVWTRGARMDIELRHTRRPISGAADLTSPSGKSLTNQLLLFHILPSMGQGGQQGTVFSKTLGFPASQKNNNINNRPSDWIIKLSA